MKIDITKLYNFNHKQLMNVLITQTNLNKKCFYHNLIVCNTRNIELFESSGKEMFNNGNSKMIQLEVLTVDDKPLYCGNVHLVKYGSCEEHISEIFTARTLKEFKTKLDNHL